MEQVCMLCKKELNGEPEQANRHPITGGICGTCARTIAASADNAELGTFLDSLATPILLMQPEPRQVYAANQRALELFGKDVSRVVGHRGGQIFDCIHAFTEAGCGKDMHCEGCKIKNAVVETFRTGSSFTGVMTELDIKGNSGTTGHHVQVSTEKLGAWAMLRIDRFEKKLNSTKG